MVIGNIIVIAIISVIAITVLAAIAAFVLRIVAYRVAARRGLSVEAVEGVERQTEPALGTSFSGIAVAGFVVSICSAFLYLAPIVALIGGVVGLCLSTGGLRDTKGRARRGRALAGWGVALAIVAIVGALYLASAASRVV